MNQNDDVVDIACIVSCLCPISFSKVSVPVRGKRCRHLQFFDKASFLELYEKQGHGPCPICLEDTHSSELVEEPYIKQLLDSTPPDQETISIKQEYSFSSNLYRGQTPSLPHYPNNRTNQVSRFYKTENNEILPIPQDSCALDDIFFYQRVENEQRLLREKSLEQKYWEYLEFYMNVFSKALEFQDRRELKSAFFVFHKVNLQQISAIQEASDMINAYSLVVSGDALVILDEILYPSDYEEDLMVCHRLDFDDFIKSKLKTVAFSRLIASLPRD